MVSNPPGMDTFKFTRVGAPVVHVLKREFPEITNASRIHRRQPIVSYDGQFYLDDIDLVDQEIINIFDFTVVAGNISLALSNPNGLVLNQSRAKKYFDLDNPIGKIITIDFDDFKRDYEVLAVIEDIPSNSQVDITSMIILDEETWAEHSDLYERWFAPIIHTYYTLKEGQNISTVNNRMPEILDRAFPTVNTTMPDFKNTDRLTMNSLNIKELHLRSEGIGEFRNRGSLSAIINFSIVAAFILLIACINFMNLSTARSSTRAKEISVRKIVGATKFKLIMQYIGEAIIFSNIALFIALCFLELTLSFFNQFMQVELQITYDMSFLLVCLFLATSVGFISGSYPALFLSKFRPSVILKSGHSQTTKGSAKLRTSLVVIQFAASITLFVATAVVYSQILYTANKDLGFEKDKLILVEGVDNEQFKAKQTSIIDELTRQSNIDYAAVSYFAPDNTSEIVDEVRTESMTPGGEPILINIAVIGHDFFKTYGISILSGRSFDKNLNEDAASNDELLNGSLRVGSIVINQSSLSTFGFKSAEDAIGKQIYVNADEVKKGFERPYRIVGVAEDTHYYSLKRSVPPVIYYLYETSGEFLSIRYNGSTELALEKLQSLWKQQLPTVPLKISFVSDLIDKQYRKEAGEATMFAAFSGLAIFIACLGLFGLASFTAERRTKEIGIRKVFGAEVWQIVKMLVFQFSKPVLIANIIAWPIAYLSMSRWLESFVYRIDDMVIIGLCLIAGLTALLIAWATVAGNSYAVARQNPIKALRYE